MIENKLPCLAEATDIYAMMAACTHANKSLLAVRFIYY